MKQSFKVCESKFCVEKMEIYETSDTKEKGNLI